MSVAYNLVMGRGSQTEEFDFADVQRSGLSAPLDGFFTPQMQEMKGRAVSEMIDGTRGTLAEALFADRSLCAEVLHLSEEEAQPLHGLFEDIGLLALTGSAHNDKLALFFEEAHVALGVEGICSTSLTLEQGALVIHLRADAETTACGAEIKPGWTRYCSLADKGRETIRALACESCRRLLLDEWQRLSHLSPLAIQIFRGDEPEPVLDDHIAASDIVFRESLDQMARRARSSFLPLPGEEPFDSFERVSELAADAYYERVARGAAERLKAVKSLGLREFFALGVPHTDPERQALQELEASLQAAKVGLSALSDQLASCAAEGGLYEASERGKQTSLPLIRWRLLAQTFERTGADDVIAVQRERILGLERRMTPAEAEFLTLTATAN